MQRVPTRSADELRVRAQTTPPAHYFTPSEPKSRGTLLQRLAGAAPADLAVDPADASADNISTDYENTQTLTLTPPRGQQAPTAASARPLPTDAEKTATLVQPDLRDGRSPATAEALARIDGELFLFKRNLPPPAGGVFHLQDLPPDRHANDAAGHCRIGRLPLILRGLHPPAPPPTQVERPRGAGRPHDVQIETGESIDDGSLPIDDFLAEWPAPAVAAPETTEGPLSLALSGPDAANEAFDLVPHPLLR